MFKTDKQNPVFLELKMKAGVYSGDQPPTSYFDPVNFKKFEIAPPPQEDDEVLSNIEGSVGEALSSESKATGAAKFTGEVDSFNEELGQIIMGADVEATSQTGQAHTNLPVLTALDRWVPIGVKRLDPDVPFVLNNDAPTEVAGSKYEVDLHLGLIKAIHADAVGNMTVNCTTLSTAGRKFNAGKAKTTHLKLIGTAKDKKSGQYGDLTIHRVPVRSDGAIDFALGKHLSGTMSGMLITPDGESSPYSFEPWEKTA